jgi:hypothetical protein
MRTSTTLKTIGVVVGAVTAVLLIALPGVAAARDRNNDRIPDHWERSHNLSLKINQAHRDQDRDALVNRKEFRVGDDPRDPDSDNDGVEDGDEGAGTISAFDRESGALTIDLFNGGSITGLVTDDTEISCDNGDDQGDEDEDDVEGDNSGPGDGGDDHSGPGDGEDDDDDAGEDDEQECSTANLMVGAIVQEAELELEDGGAVFEEIELAV